MFEPCDIIQCGSRLMISGSSRYYWTESLGFLLL